MNVIPGRLTRELGRMFVEQVPNSVGGISPDSLSDAMAAPMAFRFRDVLVAYDVTSFQDEYAAVKLSTYSPRVIPAIHKLLSWLHKMTFSTDPLHMNWI